MFDCESKTRAMRCVLSINKQLVELLFIKRSTVSEHQILQIITPYVKYKLSIDYKFELLLYNLDLLMAPIPMRLACKGTWFDCYLFDSSPLRSSWASPTSPARPPSSSAPSPPLLDPPVLAKIMLASPPSGQNPYVCTLSCISLGCANWPFYLHLCILI